MFLLRRAWNNISAITIANCFAHAGFIHQPAQEEQAEDGSLKDFGNIFDRLKQAGFCPMNFQPNDFLNVDEEVIVTAAQTDQEIINAVKKKKDADDIDSCDESLYMQEPTPTISEVRSALLKIKQYFLSLPNIDTAFDTIASLDEAIESSSQYRQTKITDFFMKDTKN